MLIVAVTDKMAPGTEVEISCVDPLFGDTRDSHSLYFISMAESVLVLMNDPLPLPALASTERHSILSRLICCSSFRGGIFLEWKNHSLI